MKKLKLNYKVERNPIIEILNTNNEIIRKIQCIGDPHFGRSFKTGVSSHRIGERERMQLAEFNRLLNPSDPLIKDIIIVGDLFDKASVSPTVMMNIINSFNNTYNNRTYYCINGNHHETKDNTKSSSYDLLVEFYKDHENIHILNESNHYLIQTDDGIIGLYFDDYDSFNGSFTTEHFMKTLKKDCDILVSFGHFDDVSIDGKGYLPHQCILMYSTIVCSGHIHTPKEYVYPDDDNECPILFTGSMQPYSHAEDPDKEIYITIKDNDLDKYDLSKDFKYKCVRIECDPLFSLTESIECLSLTLKVIPNQQTIITTDEEIQDVEQFNEVMTTKVNSDTFKDIKEDIKQELLDILKNKDYLE